MPARHCLGARSAPPCLAVLQLQDEPTYGLTGKKQGRGTGLSHMSCKNRAKPCKLFVSCKKTCKLFHVSCKLFHMQKPCKTVQAVRVMQKNVQAVPHAKTAQNCASCPHAKTAQNRASCSCHAKTAQNRARNMSKSCKNHAKTMQKPCNMRRVRWRLHRASGAAGRLRRQARQPAEHPLSPGSLLYVLYVLYLTRQATEHPLSPGFCYMC